MPRLPFPKILITGGAGFIGANVAAYYLSKGKQVTLFDNLSRPGVRHNLSWLKEKFSSKRLKIIIADINHPSRLKTAVKNQDIIFHFAGQTAVTTSIKNPRADFKANALGTFNVLEAVRQFNPQATIIYSSTNKVYGNLNRLKITATDKRYQAANFSGINESEPLDFYSPYGCSKGTGDQYVYDYARIYNLKTIVFRQSCIYGTHQFGVEDQGWVAHFTAQAIKGKPIIIYGNGKQVRDLLYISDLVSAFDKAIHRLKVTAGQIYNIGGGMKNSLSLLELIKILEQFTGKKIKLIYKPARLGDQKVYISNINKAKKDFNWSPQVNIHRGLKLLYSWLDDFLTRSKLPSAQN